jgi:hypothetical protein
MPSFRSATSIESFSSTARLGDCFPVVERLTLSLRGCTGPSASRTIADLADARRVTSAHVAESVGYRMRATCPMGQATDLSDARTMLQTRTSPKFETCLPGRRRPLSRAPHVGGSFR